MKSPMMATLAGGCFWCTQAIFERLKGVKSVISGYAGGHQENPTYDQVSSGESGHAEAIQITFDPGVISYEKLLEIYFATHDPTTLNKQGNDEGPQYRSVIFYHDNNQKTVAENLINKLSASGKYHDPIVTKVEPYSNFFKAEHHHQNYYDNNRDQPYCQLVIDPKLTKLLKEFSSEVKESYRN